MGSLLLSALGVVSAALTLILSFAYRVAIVVVFATAVFVLLAYGCYHAIGEESLPHMPATIALVIVFSMAALKGF